MTLNASKCHLLVSSYNNDLIFATMGDAFSRKEVSTKLLEIIMDSSLTFTDYVKMICKRASQTTDRKSRESQIHV